MKKKLNKLLLIYLAVCLMLNVMPFLTFDAEALVVYSFGNITNDTNYDNLCRFEGGGTKRERILGINSTPSFDGEAQYIMAYINRTDQDASARGGLYYESNNTFIAETVEHVINNTAGEWIQFNFSYPKPRVEAGTEYIICIYGNSKETSPGGTEYYININYATELGRGRHSYPNDYPNFPDPWSPTTVNRNYSIYCNYSTTYSPIISNVTPANNAENIELTSMVNLSVEDTDGQNMNITWQFANNSLWDDINATKSFMTVCPHPDDMENFAAGFYPLANASGCQVDYVSLRTIENIPPEAQANRTIAINWFNETFLKPNGGDYHQYNISYAGHQITNDTAVEYHHYLLNITQTLHPDVIITMTPQGYRNATEHGACSYWMTRIWNDLNYEPSIYWIINMEEGACGYPPGTYGEYGNYPPTCAINVSPYWTETCLIWQYYTNTTPLQQWPASEWQNRTDNHSRLFYFRIDQWSNDSWETFNTTTNTGNGSYNATNTSWISDYLTEYWLRINVNDSELWSNQTYHFTTTGDIVIDNDSEFDYNHGVTYGNGTIGNPYIIDRWTTFKSLTVRDTTMYFIARNFTVSEYVHIDSVADNTCQINNINSNNTTQAVIYLYDADNALIANCSFFDHLAYLPYVGAIYALYADYLTVTNCTFNNTLPLSGSTPSTWYKLGIRSQVGYNHIYQNCTFDTNFIGIWTENYCTIRNCTFTDCQDEGILIRGYHTFIENCNFTGGGTGIEISTGEQNATIRNCTFEAIDTGVSLFSQTGTNVQDITITNCTFNETIAGNTNAINIQDCIGFNITYCSFSNFSGNNEVAVLMRVLNSVDYIRDGIIHSNYFIDNYGAIAIAPYTSYASQVYNNTFYNNYFYNNSQYDVNNTWLTYGESDLSLQDWNITKTSGTNIINGAWFGGNYWDEYTGNDTDNDGLGDTDTPYNPSYIAGGIFGDYHPLVLNINYPPVISDVYLDGDTGVSVLGSPVAFNLTDPDDDTMFVDIWSNHTGTWTQYAGWFTNGDPPPYWHGWQACLLDLDDDGIFENSEITNWSLNSGWQYSGIRGFLGGDIAYPGYEYTTERWGMTTTATVYYYSINATDNTTWTNETFSFTTEGYVNTAPTQTNPYPANGSTEILIADLQAANLTIDVADVDGDNIDVYVDMQPFFINVSESGYDRTVSLNANYSYNESTTYYWFVNITDGIEWTNRTYHFTTEGLPQVATNATTLIEETTATLNGYLIKNTVAPCTTGFWYGTTRPLNVSNSNNVSCTGTYETGDEFSYNITGLTRGQVYYVIAWANSGTAFVVANETSYSLSLPEGWTTTGFDYGVWDRNSSINANNSTANFFTQGSDNLGDYMIVFESRPPTYHSYRFNPPYPGGTLQNISRRHVFSIYMFNASTYTINYTMGVDNWTHEYFITKPEAPTGASAAVVNASAINISWTKGTGANQTIVVSNATGLPSNPTDGTVEYNDTGAYVVLDIAEGVEYYRIWSFSNWSEFKNPVPDYVSFDWTPWIWQMSDNSTDILWGGLVLGCYNESNTSQNISFDVFISNQDGSEVYEAINCTTYHVINVSDCPHGEVSIRFESSGYRERTFYVTLEENAWYSITAYLPPITFPSEPGDEPDENYTRMYRVRVIDENTYPVDDAFVSISRYINRTGIFETVASFYTNGHGEGDIWLIPSTLYKVFITKDGYEDVTGADWSTDPYYYGANYPKVFEMYFEETQPQPPLVELETIEFTGTLSIAVNGTYTLTLTYLDNEDYTISSILIVSAFNFTTNTSSVVVTQSYGEIQNWTLNLYNIDRNMTYICNLTYIHTHLGIQHRTLVIEKQITAKDVDTELESYFDWVGVVPFGVGNLLLFLFFTAVCYYTDGRDIGKNMIVLGVIFFFIMLYLGWGNILLIAAGGAIPILFIVMGILTEWNASKKKLI